jgi:hypothetical protein
MSKNQKIKGYEEKVEFVLFVTALFIFSNSFWSGVSG